MILLFIVLYILIAAICIFLLLVCAEKYTYYTPNSDMPWPVLCGIFWPISAPLAAAYIAAKFYLKYMNKYDE